MSVVTIDGMRGSIDELEVGKLEMPDLPIKNPSGPKPRSNKADIMPKGIKICQACRKSKKVVSGPSCPEIF